MPNTAGVLLSAFSMGVPVNPMKVAFGIASLRYLAYPYFRSFLVAFLGILRPKPYWLLWASSAMTMMFFLSESVGYFFSPFSG